VVGIIIDINVYNGCDTFVRTFTTTTGSYFSRRGSGQSVTKNRAQKEKAKNQKKQTKPAFGTT
jgi:hypothetical protein